MREGVYITLALVVVVTSIFVFFSQEFGKTARKIFSVPGAKLFIPLILASILIEFYEIYGLWVMLAIKNGYHHITTYLSNTLDVPVSFLNILFLFLVVMLPVTILRLWEIRYNIPVPRPVTVQIGMYIWVCAAILFVVYQID